MVKISYLLKEITEIYYCHYKKYFHSLIVDIVIIKVLLTMIPENLNINFFLALEMHVFIQIIIFCFK